MKNHVVAVQLHSKIDDLARRHILEIIALDMDDDGVSSISFRKIAALSRLSVNTVRSYLDDILETKEVQAAAAGRGTEYRLNRSLIPYDSVTCPTHTHENGGETDRTARLSDLAGMEDRIRNAQWRDMERLYQLCQSIVSIVSPPQREGDTSGGNIYTRDSISKEKKDIYIPPDEETVVKFITALDLASKPPYGPGFNEAQYRQAAVMCIGKYDLSVIERFPSYWAKKGWGGQRGKPTLDVLLAELDNCRDDVDTRSSKQQSDKTGKVIVVADESGGYIG